MKVRRPVEMRPPVRRAFLSAYEQMMERTVGRGRELGRTTYRRLILSQVRAFGDYLQEPEKVYSPFVWDL